MRQWIVVYSTGSDTYGIHQHQLEYTPTRTSVGDAKMAHETFNALRPSVDEDYTYTLCVLDFEAADVKSD